MPLTLQYLKKRPARWSGARLLSSVRLRSAARQYVGADTPGRINRLSNRVIVIAGDDDWIAIRIDPAHDADVATTTTAHHRDSANLRAGYTGSVARIGTGKIAAASMASALEH
jgi:hypothetical protein